MWLAALSAAADEGRAKLDAIADEAGAESEEERRAVIHEALEMETRAVLREKLATVKASAKRASSSDSKSASERKSAPAIPRFYFKKDSSENKQRVLLERLARQRFLHRARAELIQDEHLSLLASLLDEAPSRLSFERWTELSNSMPWQAQPLFSAHVFLRLSSRQRDGRVAASDFFRFAQDKMLMQRTRFELSEHDVKGKGYLTEQELEVYILRLSQEIVALERLPKKFIKFYIFTAARKFLFLLDPRRTKRLPLTKLLDSSVMQEWLELQRSSAVDDRALEDNWFSASSALAVYTSFLSLDRDKSGMLSEEELQRWGDGCLTEGFVRRIFQEYRTFSGEMDYKGFLDFTLAMRHKSSAPALRYHWRLLDIDKTGYLTRASINGFFREVTAKIVSLGGAPVETGDVVDEIFDMAKPADPLHITLADLLASDMGDTVVGILSDVYAFFRYENREQLLAEEDEEEEEEEEDDDDYYGFRHDEDELDAEMRRARGSSAGGRFMEA